MSSPEIILASGSKARQDMLKNAGLNFDIMPANIDEESILNEMKDSHFVADIAIKLSQEKALSISKNHPNKYIIGSDQILSLDNKLYTKAKNIDEAKKKLNELQGKTHQLTSAVCVVKNNSILWNHTDDVDLKMKSLNEEQIETYISKAKDDVYNCVGAYAIESVGIQLFEDIKGDYFTILGMPLLPLLNFLDKEGIIT